MTSMEAQFEEMESHSSWPKVFQELKARGLSAATEFSIGESRKPESRARNRFNDVLPYDHTRVHLHTCKKKSSDYINASFVKVPSAMRSFICAQGPLPATVVHFWEMIWHQKCSAIVMLNSLIEKGMPTCATYWPKDEGTSITLEDESLCHKIKITLVKEDAGKVFATRMLNVLYQSVDGSLSEERIVYHFHFVHWPDFGVPDSPDEFLDFLSVVRQSGCFDVDLNRTESDPVVVHCTAGIGRTGTFVLVDVCLALLALYRCVDIPKMLVELRSMRMGMVQTPEQLRFCFQAIILGKKRASMETPAVSPISERPKTLELKPVPPPDMSPSCSFSELSGSPKSPRRELLRQDGRTPSLDALENAQHQSSKRRKTETLNGDSNMDTLGSLSGIASATFDGVEVFPSAIANGDAKELTSLEKRDAELRQRRIQRNERLREQVERIKQQDHATQSSWKSWTVTLVLASVGLAAFWIYRSP